ncbi:MAG: NAD(P)-dependent oxidoreductase [Sneathiellaceae bacterium]
MTAGSVLITGVNGFIGQAMARRLLAAGWQVAGADLQAGAIPSGLAQYAALDVARPDAAEGLERFAGIDAVLHAGGISGFMVARDDPARILEVNVGGTARVLEFARRHRPRRTLLCSTLMVYGPAQAALGEVDEAEAPQPCSVYGASKAAIEAMGQGYAAQFGLGVVSLRFSQVYGPGRTTECFVRDMVAAAQTTGQCRIGQVAGGQRQYVHIDDACDAIAAALAPACDASGAFNITGGECHSLAELRDLVREIVGPLQVDFHPDNDPPAYRLPRLSIRRAAESLGYVPRLSLAAGIARMAGAAPPPETAASWH